MKIKYGEVKKWVTNVGCSYYGKVKHDVSFVKEKEKQELAGRNIYAKSELTLYFLSFFAIFEPLVP